MSVSILFTVKNDIFAATGDVWRNAIYDKAFHERLHDLEEGMNVRAVTGHLISENILQLSEAEEIHKCSDSEEKCSRLLSHVSQQQALHKLHHALQKTADTHPQHMELWNMLSEACASESLLHEY